ncbi:hypothetical protein JC200_13240 [Alicyclobacillus sp. ALC3]|nr:hypothetical protein [Alicyclobacillus sp. ALC3]WDL99672.1 hypothetical protein JC200_13240 [Alicyclobacillus sp. ALC3]
MEDAALVVPTMTQVTAAIGASVAIAQVMSEMKMTGINKKMSRARVDKFPSIRTEGLVPYRA